MSGFFIRTQALTYTKSLSERAPAVAGIARSIQRYGTGIPRIMTSDDPAVLKKNWQSFCRSIKSSTLYKRGRQASFLPRAPF
jgi:hypothetical protein